MRSALQATDSGLRQPRAPDFAALWQAAGRPMQRPHRWATSFAAASLAMCAIVAFFALRTNPVGDAPGIAADRDLVLAQQLAASDPWRVPTDRLLDAAPASLASGAPSIPEFQYPLLPKERYL